MMRARLPGRPGARGEAGRGRPTKQVRFRTVLGAGPSSNDDAVWPHQDVLEPN